MHKGLRVIIVVVHVGAMKLYVAIMDALRKRKDKIKKTWFTSKIDGFLSFPPPQ